MTGDGTERKNPRHPSTLCTGCLAGYAKGEAKSGKLHIKCPSCPRSLQMRDTRELLGEELYGELVKRVAEAERKHDDDDADLVAAGLQCRSCPKCGTRIEKNDGCDQMDCWMCGEHFQWSQAKEIKPLAPTKSTSRQDATRAPAAAATRGMSEAERRARARYGAMTLTQLRRQCEDAWLSAAGTRDDMINRLVEYERPAGGWPRTGQTGTAPRARARQLTPGEMQRLNQLAAPRRQAAARTAPTRSSGQTRATARRLSQLAQPRQIPPKPEEPLPAPPANARPATRKRMASLSRPRSAPPEPEPEPAHADARPASASRLEELAQPIARPGPEADFHHHQEPDFSGASPVPESVVDAPAGSNARERGVSKRMQATTATAQRVATQRRKKQLRLRQRFEAS